MVPCRRSGYPVANGEIAVPGGEAPRHGPVQYEALSVGFALE